jgi:hypothetical protein
MSKQRLFLVSPRVFFRWEFVSRFRLFECSLGINSLRRERGEICNSRHKCAWIELFRNKSVVGTTVTRQSHFLDFLRFTSARRPSNEQCGWSISMWKSFCGVRVCVACGWKSEVRKNCKV